MSGSKRREPAKTEASGGSLRLAEDSRPSAQDQFSRAGSSGLDIHLVGGGLQPGSNAKPADAACLKAVGRSHGWCIDAISASLHAFWTFSKCFWQNGPEECASQEQLSSESK